MTDDGLERAESDFVVVGNRNGHGSSGSPALHDDMTTATPYFCKPMLRYNLADLASGENPSLATSRFESRHKDLGMTSPLYFLGVGAFQE